MAADKELVELIKKDANLMKTPDLMEKYMNKGYSQEVIQEAYREVIQTFMADDVPEWSKVSKT
jgi:SOS response regulatory protein OraA/RecX